VVLYGKFEAISEYPANSDQKNIHHVWLKPLERIFIFDINSELMCVETRKKVAVVNLPFVMHQGCLFRKVRFEMLEIVFICFILTVCCFLIDYRSYFGINLSRF